MKIWNALVHPAKTALAGVALGLVLAGNSAIAVQSGGNPLRGADDHAAQQFLPSIEQLEVDTGIRSMLSTAQERGMPIEGSGSRSNETIDSNDGCSKESSQSVFHASDVTTASATVPSRDHSTAPTGLLANWFLKSESTNTSKTAGTSTSSTNPFSGVESLQLPATFKKIAINTLIAVTLGIFFIVIVRRRHLGPKKSKAVDRTALAIEQSISLGGKSELKVIRYGQHQVMVAMDASGIKSVVSLTPAFDSAMQMVEPPHEVDQPAPEKEPVNVEQFVNMIKQMESAYSSGNTR